MVTTISHDFIFLVLKHLNKSHTVVTLCYIYVTICYAMLEIFIRGIGGFSGQNHTTKTRTLRKYLIRDLFYRMMIDEYGLRIC